MNSTQVPATDTGRRFGWPQLLLIVLITTLITVAATLWVLKYYFFPSEFTPVTLNQNEEQILNAKLERLETISPDTSPSQQPVSRGAQRQAADQGEAPLEPEAYTEEGTSRQVQFTERELNALLARNTDLAQRVAIDLSENLVSAKILIPVDEDFPMLGGKILRVKTGVEFAYAEGHPIVRLKGVSFMGVPVPNAWLGGLKNIDLVREFGTEEGFWKAFAAGVAAVKVEEGRLMIELKE